MPSPASDRSLPQLPAQTPAQTRTLGFLLREVYGVLQGHVYAAVAAAGHPGIRPAHSPILRHLPPEGGRVSDLARATGLAKQSVTYIVEDLIALGYLHTAPDPEDKRARRLLYTPRGRQLLVDLLAASQDAERALAGPLGPQQARLLRDLLEAALNATAQVARPASRAQAASPKPRRTPARRDGAR